MESFAWKVKIHNANIKTKSLKSIGYQLVYYESLYNWLGFHPPKPTQPTRGPFFNRHLKKAPPVSKSGGLTSRGGEGDVFFATGSYEKLSCWSGRICKSHKIVHAYTKWEFTMSFQANILKKTCGVCDIVGYFAGFILQSGQVNDSGASIATSPASSQRAFRMSLDLSISHDLPKKPWAVGWPFICKYTMRNNSACPLHMFHIILLMEEILHQLIGSVSNYIDTGVLYIPGGCWGFPINSIS